MLPPFQVFLNRWYSTHLGPKSLPLHTQEKEYNFSLKITFAYHDHLTVVFNTGTSKSQKGNWLDHFSKQNVRVEIPLIFYIWVILG